MPMLQKYSVIKKFILLQGNKGDEEHSTHNSHRCHQEEVSHNDNVQDLLAIKAPELG